MCLFHMLQNPPDFVDIQHPLPLSLTPHPQTHTAALIFAQVLLTQWVELKRLEDFKNPGSQADGSFFGITDDFKGVGNGYPGGKYFDFLGFSRGDAAKFEEYKLKEIKNV